MKRSEHLKYLYLTLALLTALINVRAAQTEWYLLTGPDGDFTIKFPAEPIYERIHTSPTGENGQSYHFAYGNNYFAFNYTDLRFPAQTAKITALNVIEEYARDYTKTITDAGGQVLMRTTLPDGGTEFVSKYPAGKAREMSYEQLRVYFRGSRRYVLSCTALSTSGIDQSLARRFFSSFQLYGMQRPEKVDNGIKKDHPNSPTQNTANIAWYKFKGLHGDFEAEFPDKPDYDTKAHPVTGTQVESVSFTYGVYDLSVQSSDIVPPLATHAEREQWLASATERFVRRSDLRVIRQAQLADGALQIDTRGQLDGRTMFIRARVYARSSRGYIVSCSVFSNSSTALDEPLPTRFFASFKFR
jgi:hypothetical protein